MIGPSRHAEFKLTAERLLIARSQRVLASELDFSINNGGALALTGPNGAGQAAGGTLNYNGQPIAGDAAEDYQARCAYLGHRLGLKPSLSVADNLAFWCRLRDRPPAAAPAALEALGIAGLADVPVRLLSEGQTRRVALARVMASGACLWLLDEPNTALDEDARQRLAHLVNDHLAAGGAVIAATHSPLNFFAASTIRLGRPAPEK